MAILTANPRRNLRAIPALHGKSPFRHSGRPSPSDWTGPRLCWPASVSLSIPATRKRSSGSPPNTNSSSSPSPPCPSSTGCQGCPGAERSGLPPPDPPSRPAPPSVVSPPACPGVWPGWLPRWLDFSSPPNFPTSGSANSRSLSAGRDAELEKVRPGGGIGYNTVSKGTRP